MQHSAIVVSLFLFSFDVLRQCGAGRGSCAVRYSPARVHASPARIPVKISPTSAKINGTSVSATMPPSKAFASSRRTSSRPAARRRFDPNQRKRGDRHAAPQRRQKQHDVPRDRRIRKKQEQRHAARSKSCCRCGELSLLRVFFVHKTLHRRPRRDREPSRQRLGYRCCTIARCYCCHAPRGFFRNPTKSVDKRTAES